MLIKIIDIIPIFSLIFFFARLCSFTISEYDTRLIKSLPQDMSFCIADIKFTDTSFKILEFGEGGRSRFKGYDALFGVGTMWAFFWNYLSSFQVPVWLVGIPDDAESRSEMNFELFTKIGGKTAQSLTDLKYHIIDDLEERYGTVKDYHCKDYEGIVLVKKNGSPNAINKMKKIFPQIIFIGELSNRYVNNKYYMNLLFESNELKKYRPQCRSYESVYDASIAQNVIKEFGGDVFVIKPVNASLGHGIIMVKKDKLDDILKIILGNKRQLRTSGLPEEYRYWSRYYHSRFFIERYEPSKTIFIDNQPYDATMRLVFALDYQNDNLDVTIFDGYWKLPAYPLTANCSLTDKHKSHVKANILSSTKADPKDLFAAKYLLEQVLHQVYWQMIKTRFLSFENACDIL